MVRAYSSVVEHYVDIVGVASSILATPTIVLPLGAKQPRNSIELAGFFFAWRRPEAILRDPA